MKEPYLFGGTGDSPGKPHEKGRMDGEKMSRFRFNTISFAKKNMKILLKDSSFLEKVFMLGFHNKGVTMR
jgi:hypothetical protein